MLQTVIVETTGIWVGVPIAALSDGVERHENRQTISSPKN
jgi:hypothetical protein